jgi:DnaJ-domain-containing protein 1
MRALANIDPAKFKKWLIALGVAYLLFPRDLIPDWMGRGLGLVDDAALVAFLTYFYRKRLREFAARAAGAAARGGAESGQQQRARSPGAAPPKRPPDPFETLGVARSASKQEIDAAYKARMQEYHPDKVAHLGSELQDLAHHKALEIQQAYQQLRK